MLYPDTPLKTDGLMEEFIIYTEKNKVIKSERIFPSLEIRRAITAQCSLWGTERGYCIHTMESREKTAGEKKKTEGDGDRESNRINCIICDKDTM